MYIKIGRVRVHVGFPFAAFCAFAAGTDKGERLVLVFVCALLHEAGHLAVLVGFGDREPTLFLSPGGARIESRLSGELPYKNDAAVAAAGPAVNLVLSLAFLLLFRITGGERLLEAARTNLALGAVNLLPLSFLDGGRLLSDLLYLRFDETKARRLGVVFEAVSFFALVCLFASAAAAGENTLFLGVFLCYCVLQKTAFRHLK